MEEWAKNVNELEFLRNLAFKQKEINDANSQLEDMARSSAQASSPVTSTDDDPNKLFNVPDERAVQTARVDRGADQGDQVGREISYNPKVVDTSSGPDLNDSKVLDQLVRGMAQEYYDKLEKQSLRFGSPNSSSDGASTGAQQVASPQRIGTPDRTAPPSRGGGSHYYEENTGSPARGRQPSATSKAAPKSVGVTRSRGSAKLNTSAKPQGRVTAGDISGDYSPSPEQQMVDFGKTVGDYKPVMKSIGRRALSMVDPRNGPIGQMANTLDDAYQLVTGNPEGTQGMKMYRGAAERLKGLASGNPDAIQETALDIAQGSAGAAVGMRGRTPSARSNYPATPIRNRPPKPPVEKPATGYYDPKVGEILGGSRAPDLKNPKAAPPPNQRPNNAPYDPKAKMTKPPVRGYEGLDLNSAPSNRTPGDKYNFSSSKDELEKLNNYRPRDKRAQTPVGSAPDTPIKPYKIEPKEGPIGKNPAKVQRAYEQGQRRPVDLRAGGAADRSSPQPIKVKQNPPPSGRETALDKYAKEIRDKRSAPAKAGPTALTSGTNPNQKALPPKGGTFGVTDAQRAQFAKDRRAQRRGDAGYKGNGQRFTDNLNVTQAKNNFSEPMPLGPKSSSGVPSSRKSSGIPSPVKKTPDTPIKPYTLGPKAPEARVPGTRKSSGVSPKYPQRTTVINKPKGKKK